MNTVARMMAVVIVAGSARAEIAAGPKGGKLLENEAPRAEFFVNQDRKVEVTFYDENLKPVAPTEQIVNVIAEAESGKAKLELEKTGTGFISKTALPEGDGYMIVVQIKSSPSAKNQNFRVPFHSESCPECQRAEYACICEEHGEGDGHDHGH
jgi:hypothetical protein